MSDSHKLLKACLFRLSIDPSHKGYVQLIDCVDKCVELKTKHMETIYTAVAGKYGIQYKSVMRNISYSLRRVRDLDDRLSALMGFPVDPDNLHNASIIVYLAEIVSEPALFDFKLE